MHYSITNAINVLINKSHRNRTEMGYVLYKSQIWPIVQDEGEEAAYGSDEDREGSSVYRLITEKDLSLREFMVGPDSLGAYLEEEGYGAVPSPSLPRKGT